LSWPAFYNGYPLIYPDSMTYLEDGRRVSRALFLHQFSVYYGMRSLVYSLVIEPFHWNVTPWPVVALQALILAFTLWLVMRSIAPAHIVSRYVTVVALLAAFTGVSWFVSLIMPDILGPALYLSIYLLVFARKTLSRAEHVGVAAIAWWGLTSHFTHMMVATGLCVLLALLFVCWPRLMRGRWKAVVEVALIIVVAAAAQEGLNKYLYGNASLNGEHPPYLMARVIADGPGRWYLEQHCRQEKYAICNYVHQLPDDPDDFLWGEHAIWETASEETAAQLRDEEVRFALAVLRAYPGAELSRALSNSGQQLITVGVDDFNSNDWALAQFDSTMPSGRAPYLRGRQARDSLPLDFFSSVHAWAVIASLPVILVFAVLVWRRRKAERIEETSEVRGSVVLKLLGLSVVIVAIAVGNALATAALSTIDDRYESRVIWLLPFLAAVLVLVWFDYRGAPSIAKSASFD